MNTQVSDFMKTYGVTGNPAIDGLILAHIIPIILEQSTKIIELLKTISLLLFRFCIEFITNKFNAKFKGDILCTVVLKKDTDKFMYNFLDEQMFFKNIKSDQVDKILEFSDDWEDPSNTSENIEKKLNEHFLKKYQKKNIALNLKVEHKENNVLTSDKIVDDKITKIFKAGNHYIKFIKYSKNNMISIKLLNFKFNMIDDDNNLDYHITIIEYFLEQKLNLKKFLQFKYHVIIRDLKSINALAHFRNNNFIDSNKYLLNYGDSFETNINDQDTFLKNYEFNNNSIDTILNNVMSNSTALSTSQVTSKYNIIITEGIGYQGYFKKNNKIYYNYNNGQLDHMYIISLDGELSIQNIQNDINWIIETGKKNSCLTTTKNKKPMNILKRKNNNWETIGNNKRSFDSLYLNDNIKNSINHEITTFLNSKEFFEEFEISYRKGLLFHGPPGTGKTSVVRAISFEFQLPIYIINVNDSEINDESISDILNSIGGSPKIVLFEDIDSAFVNEEELASTVRINEELCKIDDEKYKLHRKYKKNINDQNHDEKNKNSDTFEEEHKITKTVKCLTYSGLLNAFDGILSNQTGVITIMTTNYIEKLGGALIRPGRIDNIYYLGYCDIPQINNMINGFIFKKLKFDKDHMYTKKIIDKKISNLINKITDSNNNLLIKIKPCELQSYILTHIMNIENIFDNVGELLKYIIK